MSGSELVSAKEIAKALGMTRQAAMAKADKQKWPHEKISGRRERRFLLERLPGEVQTALAASGAISIKALPLLLPEAALELVRRATGDEIQTNGFLPIAAGGRRTKSWSDETALDMTVIRDGRVAKWSRIIQEAIGTPPGWKKRAWIEDVAGRRHTTASTIYRQIQKYQKKGLAGLKHTKGNRRQPKAWTPEAVDYWIGLCIKKEHRKIAKDALYAILTQEAARKGWRVGGYESALWWAKQRITPQLLALQRGGVRALDNTLPPVIRSYADLAPFEILVGDQHRFDFWVTDEDTGEVFRPEGYFWQDLRTRAFYGAAVGKKYDSYLMGLALRMGLKIFGPFGSIYTDHGKPEESNYIMGIMKDMRALGMEARQTVDAPVDLEEDPEEINPLAAVAGTHRMAIVRNAKAKMIEGTFRNFEGVLRDHFFVPGYVKKLGGLQEENEIDQKDIERLARAGKLLTFREFALTMLRAMDYYNSVKAHRGVQREWSWRPKPKKATPMDCLKQCCAEGWRPVMLSDEAIDLVFLPRANRVVDRSRITLHGEPYGDDRLIKLDKQRVEVRFDPLDPGWVLVFKDGEYLARALPAEYSSMKDLTLAQRKIEEKRRQRKGFILEYRTLTSAIPDVREYSQVPRIEKAAASISKEQRAKSKELEEANRPMSEEEIAAEINRLEAQNARRRTRQKKVPDRPGYFRTALDRYKWIVECELAGGKLDEADTAFKLDYESHMDAGRREHWAVVRELGGIS